MDISCGAGGIKRGQQRNREGNGRYENSVAEARGEGERIQRVNLGVEMDVVMAAEPGEQISEDEAGGGSDNADEETLEDEDAADLFLLNSHGHEDGDVFGFFHDHHGERGEDVERGDQDNESENDEGDELFKTQRAKELAVLLHPCCCHEAGAGVLFELGSDGCSVVEIVQAEGNDGDDVGLAEEPLGIGQAHECPGAVVFIEAGLEDAGNLKALIFRKHAEGCELALWAGDHDDGADTGIKGVSEIFAEEDGGRGSVGGIRLEGLRAAEFDGGEDIADAAFFLRKHAFDECATSSGSARDEHLAVEGGGRSGDVGLAGELIGEPAPVADAVALDSHELDVRGGAEEALLQIAAHAVGDGKSDDERGHAGHDAEHRECRDEPDNGLTAAGAEIAVGDKEFEAQVAPEYHREAGQNFYGIGRRLGRNG
jgi:hypothetical protein